MKFGVCMCVYAYVCVCVCVRVCATDKFPPRCYVLLYCYVSKSQVGRAVWRVGGNRGGQKEAREWIWSTVKGLSSPVRPPQARQSGMLAVLVLSDEVGCPGRAL
ncbi:hypothetical protein BGZ63DRAFT_396336 [Mariannaea sp. PMI_226]|nr:hypothetical protein BGZ63DRAFT_396336 [Mariannaea sp. PMI_226]